MSKTIIFVILFSIILLMGLSRMILGVHFLDQVLFGYILGFITLAFVKEVIWPLFFKNIQEHKEKGKST
jgi:membrane-associated phospholipid phosphatase